MKKICFLILTILFFSINAYADNATANRNYMQTILQHRNYNMQGLLSKLHGKTKKNFQKRLYQREQELHDLQMQYK